MIWAVKVKGPGRVQVEKEVVEKTIAMYCIGCDNRPLFLFGIVPMNLALKSGFLWIELMNRPRLGELRLLVKHWPEFREKLGWKLIAFCRTENEVAQNFMKFFGFEKTAEDSAHVIYTGVA